MINFYPTAAEKHPSIENQSLISIYKLKQIISYEKHRFYLVSKCAIILLLFLFQGFDGNAQTIENPSYGLVSSTVEIDDHNSFTNCATGVSIDVNNSGKFCPGATATLTASVAGTGNDNISYQWFDNGSTNLNIGGIGIGSPTSTNTGVPITYNPSTAITGTKYYYLVVTNTDGPCGNSSYTSNAIGVTVTKPVINSLTAPAITCFGGSTSITVDATGAGILQYKIGAGSYSTNNVFSVSAGNHTITVKDENDCETSQSINITQPAVLNASIASNPVTCFGGNNGEIIIQSPSGGSGSYQYSINGGSGWFPGFTFTGLSIGTYDIRIRDAAQLSCVVTLNATFSLTQVAELSATVASTPVSCFGGNTGTITVSAPAGGSGNYQYRVGAGAWQATGNFTGLSANTYSVLIRDAANTTCIKVLGDEIVTQPAVLSATVNKVNVSCFGAGNGSITIANPMGGNGTYEYRLNAGTWQNTLSFPNLVPNTYSVQIRDAAFPTCELSIGNQIVIQPVILSATVTKTNVTCNGASDGTITIASPGGGYGTYEYSINGGTSWHATGTFTGLAPATYNVQIRDAANTGCIGTLGNQDIDQFGVLGATVTKTNITCNNLNDGKITIASPTGGSGSFEYRLGSGAWQSGSPGITFINLSEGTYVVQIRDANNQTCIITLGNQTIIRPATITASVVVANITCSGLIPPDGSITVTNPSGGSGNYQYRRTTTGNTWYDNPVFSALGVSDYEIQIRDKDNTNCVVPLGTFSVFQPQALSGSLSKTNVTCNGISDGTISINGGGGSNSFEYSINGGTWQSSGNFINLAPNTYTVAMRDATYPSCTRVLTSQTITQPLALNASIAKTDVTCNGAGNGTISISGPSGGSGTFEYRLGTGTWQATGIFTGLGPSNYLPQMRDKVNAGCVFSFPNQIVTEPIALTGSATTTDASCFASTTGSVTASASGGAGTYMYSLNGGAYQVSPTFSNLPTGSYNVTIRDANSCTFSVPTVNVTQPTAGVLGTISAQTNVTCFGLSNGSVTITGSGGIGGFTYRIGSNSYGPSGTFSGLAAGNYSITVRDGNNCTFVVTVNITQPLALGGSGAVTSNYNGSQISCSTGQGTTNDGIITLSGTGGTSPYQYSIDGTNYLPSDTFKFLSANTYNLLKIKDANGCIFSVPAVILSAPPPIVTSTWTYTGQPEICEGGTFTYTSSSLSGGTGTLVYNWTGPNGFIALNTQTISTTNAPLSAAGRYYVSVVDANGCTATNVFKLLRITVRPKLDLSYGNPLNQFCDNNNTLINPIFTNTAGYYERGNFTSSPAGLSIDNKLGTFNPSTSTPASYIVTYATKDSLNCPNFPFNVPVTITPRPTASFTYVNAPFCSTDGVQSVTLAGSNKYLGGTFSPVTNLVITSDGTINPSLSIPGTYNVTYNTPAADGCASIPYTQPVTITPLPVISSFVYNSSLGGTPFCSNEGVASPVLSATGAGPSFYSTSSAGLQLNNTSGNIDLGVSTAGNYMVTYTKSANGGCPAVKDSTPVTITRLPEATISYAPNPVCPTNSAAAITLTGTMGGTYTHAALTGGILIMNASGTIDGVASTQGDYIVKYGFVASGGCPVREFTTAVKIGDAVPPVLVVPPAITVQCAANTLPVNTGQATATDNCSPNNQIVIGYTDVISAQSCTNRYTITRTWTATDLSSNVASGTQIINVFDNTAPVFTNFPANMTVPNPNGVPGIDFSLITATDNCGTATITLLSEVYEGLDNKPGFCPTKVTRTFRATDACGNFTDRIQVITVSDVSSCGPCQDIVPFRAIDLTASATASFTTDQITRNGLCCKPTGEEKCVSLIISLHPSAVGVSIEIDGNAPTSTEWDVSCATATINGNIICLPGGVTSSVTFCKKDDLTNIFKITSITGAELSNDFTSRIGCDKPINVNGLDPASIQFYDITGGGIYLPYLSASSGSASVTFTAGAGAPSQIRYRVSGTLLAAGTCGSAGATDSDTITINVIAPINATFDVPTNVCAGNLKAIKATVTPNIGTYTYTWKDGLGNTVATGSSEYTPTVPGAYTLTVSETTLGIGCNSITFAPVTVTFDQIAPIVTGPAASLTIECNNPGSALAISNWLSQATASDNVALVNPGGFTNDYTAITQACGTSQTVTFTATDHCGATSSVVGTIQYIDTNAPSIVCPGNIQIECATNVPSAYANVNAFTAAGGSLSDICDPSLTLAFVSDVITNQVCDTKFDITRTYRTTDDCNNQATCIQTINVRTVSLPLVPPDSTKLIQCLKDALVPVPPVVKDKCNNILTPTLIVSGDVSCEGAKVYTYTYTDCSGLSSVWKYTYTVQKISTFDDPPDQDTTVDNGAAARVFPTPPVVLDVCGEPIIPFLVGIDSTSTNPKCSGIVRYKYWYVRCDGPDIGGFFQTWNYTYFIIVPVPTINPPITQTLCQVTGNTYTIPLPTYGASSPLTATISYKITGATTRNGAANVADASGTFNVGTSTIEWTVRDECGKTAIATTTVIINAAPAIPTANNITACELSPIQTLTAVASPATGSTIVWYTAATGGSVVASPTLNTVGSITYYAASRFISTGCESLTRTAVTLTINATPAVPTNANNIMECELSPIQTLTATATPATGATIVWYTAATGGSVVGSPTLNTVGSITYYAASSFTSTGCESLTRAAVMLTINAAPAVPTNPINVTECEQSPIQTLTATATPAIGSTIVWYTAATGGSVVTSPTLNTVGSITYYAASRLISTGCESLTRVAVTLMIKPLPQATISLAASYCNNVLVNPTVGVSVVSGGAFTNTSFSYAPVPATPAWPANGLAINTTTGLINLAGSLAGDYVVTYTFTGANGCVNTAQTIAVINAPPDVTLSPEDKFTCQKNDFTFYSAATGKPIPGVQWQISTTNGSTWSNINNEINPNYNIFNVGPGMNGDQYRAVYNNVCGSDITNAAILKVGAPINTRVDPTNVTVCNALSSVTLSAIANGGNGTLAARWQVSSNGSDPWTDIPGTYIESTTGNIYPSYTFAANLYPNGTHFRIKYGNGGCEESVTSGVIYAVNPTATVNKPSDVTGACAGSPVAIDFTGNQYATSYTWTNTNTSIGLAASGSGNISFNATDPGTAVIRVTPNYTGGNPIITCAGAWEEFTITVNPLPSAPSAEPPAACGPDNVTFVPAGCSGSMFRYYDVANGGTPLGSGATFTTFVNDTKNYYISCVQNGCEGPRATVQAIVYPVNAGTVGIAQTVCVGGDPSPLISSSPASFTSNGIQGTLTYRWQASTSTDGGFTWSSWTYVSTGVKDPGTPPSFDPLSGITTTTRYRREVFAERTNGPAPQFKCYAYTLPITIDVIGLSSAGTISGGNQCALTAPPTLNGTAATTIGGASPTYQWQSSTTGCGGTWTNIAGATGDNYTPLVMPSQTTTYRRLTQVSLNGITCPTTAEVSGCVTINVFAVGPNATWTCATNNGDWFDCRNWNTGMVPDQFTNVTIPAIATCDPVIDANSTNTTDGIAYSNNITIEANANLSFSSTTGGTLRVSGNWNNLAGTAGFAAGNGTVAFVGSSAQTINTTGAAENFHSLLVDKPSAGNVANGLTLNDAVNVGGTLTLTSGIVNNRGTANLLNITNCNVGAVVGGSDISYINGQIRRCTNSTNNYTLPVGDPDRTAGAYRPAYVQPAGSGNNVYTGEYYYGDVTINNFSVLDLVIGVINNEQWMVKGESCSSPAASVGFTYINPGSNTSWSPAGPSGCPDCNVGVVYQPSSLDWYFTGQSGTFDGTRPESRKWDGAPGMVWSKFMDMCNVNPYFSFGFSDFRVLPIHLLSFTGVLENKQALLQWTVADNKEVNSFIVEHSADGINFRKAGQVNAGNSVNYRFVHNGLVSGNNYYRLYMIGKDGTKIYSKVVLIIYNRIVTSIVSLKPTLVHDLTQVTVLSASNQRVHIQFFDTRGRLVRTEKAQLKMGMNTIPVYAQGLASEMYIIHILTDDGAKGNYKIMKE